MPSDDSYYKGLITKFVSNQLSVEEVRALFDFIKAEPEKYLEFSEDPELLYQISAAFHAQTKTLPTEVDTRLRARMNEAVEGIKHRSPLRFLVSYKAWTVAASILLLVGWATLWWVAHRRVQQPKEVAAVLANDIPPGGNMAILTLGNGSTLSLDSAHIGQVIQQGGASVTKTDSGKLAYTDTKEPSSTLVYNTLTIPKGAQYHLRLADGTEVWLNAASSIRFPTAFTGHDRTVNITGEAYFEVAPDMNKPFYVDVNDLQVQVLGTHFNINAYGDENEVMTTLLEGSVRVKTAASALTLKPGQQAIITKASQDNPDRIGLVSQPALDEVMAWKNGRFQFNNTPITEVLQQLSRWYDVEVEYRGDVRSKRIWGEMERDLNLSEVLDGLKDIGVNFKIEGRKLIVMP